MISPAALARRRWSCISAGGFILPATLAGNAEVRFIVAMTVVAICNGIEAGLPLVENGYANTDIFAT